MNIVEYPTKSEWQRVSRRPDIDYSAIENIVRNVLDSVKSGGDAAVRRFTKQFDGVDLDSFAIDETEITAAFDSVPDELAKAIGVAKANIETFHQAQRRTIQKIETTPGVVCWQKSVAIQRVGLYIPAGSAPLFSTVLMLVIPAVIAGCKEIVVCSPPGKDGKVDPTILYAARLCGATKVYKMGGAQAIAALAYGTETIERADKIFGPGNSYVTCAKKLVSADVAIDMPAGPSEVLVLADDSANPAFVAADLLSQAEHGPDSQVLLVSTSKTLVTSVIAEINKQLANLPRRQIAEAALSHSTAVVVDDLAEAVAFVNDYATEHLILAVEAADEIAEQIVNAGSVFIGNYSCETAGDYASGTNHTLPTHGFARSFGGVSVDSFVKHITFQKLTADGIRNLGPTLETLAWAEGLDAHKRAVSIRLEALSRV